MIGISAIATHVPDKFVSNYEQAERFGVTRDFIDQKLGIRRVSRKPDNQDTADLCERAFASLSEAELTGLRESVDCVIVCTQNPDGSGLPHTAAILHGRLEFPQACACFDISLGCTGFVHTLALAKSFMEAHGFENGLLFTCDPYSKILDPDDKNTSMIFGDAATVTVLKHAVDVPLLTPRATRFYTDGSRWSGLHKKAGKLIMNGAAVFNFSATVVPREVAALLASLNLVPDDVDLYLFHQGSKFILDAIQARTGLPKEKIPYSLWEQGNTVSSTIPMMLQAVIVDQAARRVLLSGFGVGLAVATSVLERTT